MTEEDKRLSLSSSTKSVWSGTARSRSPRPGAPQPRPAKGARNGQPRGGKELAFGFLGTAACRGPSRSLQRAPPAACLG